MTTRYALCIASCSNHLIADRWRPGLFIAATEADRETIGPSFDSSEPVSDASHATLFASFDAARRFARGARTPVGVAFDIVSVSFGPCVEFVPAKRLPT